MFEQPTHPQMDRILRLENDIEILENSLQEKKHELERAKTEKKWHKIRAILWLLLIGIALPLAFATIVYFSTQDLEPVREYFGISRTFLDELIPASALATPLGAMLSLVDSILYFDHKRKIKSLSPVIEYLQSKIQSSKLSLEDIKQNTQKTDSLVEGAIQDLKVQQHEYLHTINRELEIAESIGTTSCSLEEIEPILEDRGFTAEEISEVAKHMTLKPKNSDN